MNGTIRYLLVGGGLASVNAAAAIREKDADGSIMIVGDEARPPYDRPPLSKDFLSDLDKKPEDIESKEESFYSESNVQVKRGARVTRIDRQNRQVTLDDGSTVEYEKLLLATGARPRPLSVPGRDLSGVHLLRRVDDSEAIRTALQSAKKVVIVGTGFIGMEVAAVCAGKGLDVTVISPQSYPWEFFASSTLGGFIRGYYEKNGVKFLFEDEVTAFEGDGKLEAAVTKKDARIEADLAVVGIGVSLNTEIAKDAGLDVDEKGAVKVDSTLQTSDANIWAAGDIASFDDVAMGKRWHIEHYMNAMWQGEAAGRNMAGDPQPFDQVPYFFSDEFDLSMILRGDSGAKKETTVLGDLDGGEFIELYPGDNGEVRMGIAYSHDYEKLEPISDTLEASIRAKKPVSEIQLGDLTG